MLDGGYDVMDYTTVDPVFGTMADLDRLVEACHGLGVRIILDLVMNHTSDQHPWFVQSRRSRTGPFADHYLWRDPSGWDREGRPEPPNNWLSWFGGSAWAWEPAREQFYLHTFLPEQPDVNWRSPALREEMWSMVRGWLDRGIDGFRLDVFNAFVKAGDLPSNPEIEAGGPLPWDTQEHRYDKDQPELNELLAEFRAIVDAHPGTATVGELFTSGIDAAVSYWAPRHLVFDWLLIETPWSAAAFRDSIATREAAWAGRWPAIVLSNHDRSRHVSRYLQTLGRADLPMADAVAKAAATIELTLRGTPFLYYGEEIGACDIVVPRADAQDRAAVQMAGWWNCDGCRAPMAWSGDRRAGFTEGRPWLPIPPRTRNHGTWSASEHRKARSCRTTGDSSPSGVGPRRCGAVTSPSSTWATPTSSPISAKQATRPRSSSCGSAWMAARSSYRQPPVPGGSCSPATVSRPPRSGRASSCDRSKPSSCSRLPLPSKDEYHAHLRDRPSQARPAIPA